MKYFRKLLLITLLSAFSLPTLGKNLIFQANGTITQQMILVNI